MNKEANCVNMVLMRQIKTTVSRATSRNDMETVRDALEIAFQVHRKDRSGVDDFIQRHLETLPVWDEFRCVYYTRMMHL
jgi:hypothetical protein